MDNEAGVSVRLSECTPYSLLPVSHFIWPGLPPSEKIASLYSRPYELSYVVSLAGHQLSTDIHVHNPATSGNLEFQALLHNYIRAPAKDVLIEPLQRLAYFDKVKGEDKVETRPGVDVKSPTDSVSILEWPLVTELKVFLGVRERSPRTPSVLARRRSGYQDQAV